MKATKVLVLCFLTLILAGCTADDGYTDGKPYYRFTQSDREKLFILPTVGNTKAYQNQDGETITFTIQEAEQGKTTYSTGSFWGNYGTVHFHYDHQFASMSYVPGYLATQSTIELKRYPLNWNDQIENANEGAPAFFGDLIFPLWNGYSNSIRIQFNLSQLSMTFNGKTYDKVNIFTSGRSEVLDPDIQLPFRPKNVYKIYYDYSYGVIGFDDLNGKQWRLL
jgi:hypothetical protein